jgi:hypothetical protein
MKAWYGFGSSELMEEAMPLDGDVTKYETEPDPPERIEAGWLNDFVQGVLLILYLVVQGIYLVGRRVVKVAGWAGPVLIVAFVALGLIFTPWTSAVQRYTFHVQALR